jgi:hypothetical protein
MKGVLIAVCLAAVAFGAGWLSRPRPPSVAPPPLRTDTLYYPLPIYERQVELVFEKGDDVLFTDTFPYPVTVERIVTETEYVGWELPETWGIEALQSPVSPAESLLVSLRGITVDEADGVKIDRRMERIWTPGYLTYLEVDVNGELRMDFAPFVEEKKGSTLLRWIERGAFVALGAFAF